MDTDKLIHKKLQARWYGIKKRCYDRNSDHYHSYGARGVTMCDDWLNSFKVFEHDVKKLPGYNEDLLLKKNVIQLDKDLRIPGAKCYNKETCSWVSRADNVKIKPSYMWVHYAYDLNNNVLYKFYNLHEFVKHFPCMKEKSVSKVSTGKDKNQNTGWLNGMFFFGKDPSKDRMRIFSGVNVQTGDIVESYRMSQIISLLHINRNTAYKMVSPSCSHEYYESHVKRLGWKLSQISLTFADVKNRSEKTISFV
jgi:hypothetical protein